MPLRVIQWATGGVGRATIAAVGKHPELELVGCWVHSADKSGTDAGVLAGGDPIGVTASWQPESIAAGLARNPGIVATANHCVNSIPAVCAAAPGIATYKDLPLVAGRAHPDLTS